MGLACCASDSKQNYDDVDGERRKSDPFFSRFVDDGETMSRSSASDDNTHNRDRRREELSERESSRSSERSHRRDKYRREKEKKPRRRSRRQRSERKLSSDSSPSSSDSRSLSRTRKKKPKPVASKKSHRDRRKSGRHKYERVRSVSESSSSSRSEENTSGDGRGSVGKRRRDSRREKSHRRRDSSHHPSLGRQRSNRSRYDKPPKHKKKYKGSTNPRTFAEVLSENYASSLPDIPEHSYMSESHSISKHKKKEKEKIKHRKLLQHYRESNNTLSSTPSYYRQKSKLTAENNIQSGHLQRALPSIRSTLTSEVDGRMSGETLLLKNLSDAPVEPRSTPSIKIKKKKKKKEKERGRTRTKVASLFQRGEHVLFRGERCLVMKVTKEIPPIYTVRNERTRERNQTDACKLSPWKPTLTTESSAAKYSTSVSVMSEELHRKKPKQMDRSSNRERSRDCSESRGLREKEKARRKKKKKKKKKKYREGRRESSSEGRIRDSSLPREGEESIVLKLYE